VVQEHVPARVAEVEGEQDHHEDPEPAPSPRDPRRSGDRHALQERSPHEGRPTPGCRGGRRGCRSARTAADRDG
jgi:hypothetical protein